INSSETNNELANQVSLARELTQQGFPSLVLEIDGVIQQIPLDYSDYKTTLAYIQKAS
ncbi:MAG TPA: DsbA family protein, partial [Colwellia sp.]|nr:DsbA family protein [Colwellia sp.]